MGKQSKESMEFLGKLEALGGKVGKNHSFASTSSAISVESEDYLEGAGGDWEEDVA